MQSFRKGWLNCSGLRICRYSPTEKQTVPEDPVVWRLPKKHTSASLSGFVRICQQLVAQKESKARTRVVDLLHSDGLPIAFLVSQPTNHTNNGNIPTQSVRKLTSREHARTLSACFLSGHLTDCLPTSLFPKYTQSGHVPSAFAKMISREQ